MQTKRAIGNYVHRYVSVLKKCSLLNTFGSLALASAIALGTISAGSMPFIPNEAYAVGVAEDIGTLITPTLGNNSGYALDDTKPSKYLLEIQKYLLSGDTYTPKTLYLTLKNTSYGSGSPTTIYKFYKNNTTNALKLFIDSDDTTGYTLVTDSQSIDVAGTSLARVDNNLVADIGTAADPQLFFGISANSGGAISNNSDVNSNIYADFVANYASSSSHALGGAISNEGKINTITGDFIANYATASVTVTACGGAIYNKEGTIGTITGNFIANSAYGTSPSARGGAIHNSGGIISTITGDFIANYADSSNSSAYAGAIYNAGGSITTITGDFIDNYANSFPVNSSSTSFARGGAIYNTKASITSIIGDFISNSVSTKSTARGGAIYSSSSVSIASEIGTITGDFIDNYVSSNTGEAGGGAIYLYPASTTPSLIGNITGDFIGNYASSSANAAQAGAIYNAAFCKINNITGDFIANYASGTDSVNGGAINNLSTIYSITGDFIDNYASSTNSVNGGAIRNILLIKNLSASFINNSARGTSALGGAIYNTGQINISTSDLASTATNKNILFKGNYIQQGATVTSNAIYNSSSAGIINLNALNGYSITFEDAISGGDTTATYGTININMVGTSTDLKEGNNLSTSAPTNGTVNFQNDVLGNIVNMYNGTLNIGKTGESSEVEMSGLVLKNGTTNILVNTDFAVDTFTYESGALNLNGALATTTANIKNNLTIETLLVGTTAANNKELSATNLTIDAGKTLNSTNFTYNSGTVNLNGALAVTETAKINKDFTVGTLLFGETADSNGEFSAQYITVARDKTLNATNFTYNSGTLDLLGKLNVTNNANFNANINVNSLILGGTASNNLELSAKNITVAENKTLSSTNFTYNSGTITLDGALIAMNATINSDLTLDTIVLGNSIPSNGEFSATNLSIASGKTLSATQLKSSSDFSASFDGALTLLGSSGGTSSSPEALFTGTDFTVNSTVNLGTSTNKLDDEKFYTMGTGSVIVNAGKELNIYGTTNYDTTNHTAAGSTLSMNAFTSAGKVTIDGGEVLLASLNQTGGSIIVEDGLLGISGSIINQTGSGNSGIILQPTSILAVEASNFLNSNSSGTKATSLKSNVNTIATSTGSTIRIDNYVGADLTLAELATLKSNLLTGDGNIYGINVAAADNSISKLFTVGISQPTLGAILEKPADATITSDKKVVISSISDLASHGGTITLNDSASLGLTGQEANPADLSTTLLDGSIVLNNTASLELGTNLNSNASAGIIDGNVTLNQSASFKGYAGDFAIAGSLTTDANEISSITLEDNSKIEVNGVVGLDNAITSLASNALLKANSLSMTVTSDTDDVEMSIADGLYIGTFATDPTSGLHIETGGFSIANQAVVSAKSLNLGTAENNFTLVGELRLKDATNINDSLSSTITGHLNISNTITIKDDDASNDVTTQGEFSATNVILEDSAGNQSSDIAYSFTHTLNISGNGSGALIDSKTINIGISNSTGTLNLGSSTNKIANGSYTIGTDDSSASLTIGQNSYLNIHGASNNAIFKANTITQSANSSFALNSGALEIKNFEQENLASLVLANNEAFSDTSYALAAIETLGTNNQASGNIGVGRNAAIALGSADSSDVNTFMKENEITFEANKTTAVLMALNPFEVTTTAKILIDGSKNTFNLYYPTPNVLFAEHSLFAVDYTTLATSPALTGVENTGTKPTIHVAASSKLLIAAPEAGDSTILTGFDFVQADGTIYGSTTDKDTAISEAWNKEDLILSNLFTVTKTEWTSSGEYKVSIAHANSGGYDAPVNDLISALPSVGVDTNSSNPAINFLSKATTGVSGPVSQEETSKAVESALQIATISGAQPTTVTASTTTSNVVQSRTSYASPTANISNNSTALHMDSNGVNLASANDIAKSETSGLSSGSEQEISSSGLKNGFGIWLMPLYQHDKASGLESSGSFTSGYNSDTSGVVLGIDTTFAEKFRLGLAFNLGQTKSSSENSDYTKSDSDSKFYGLSAYGAMILDNFGLSANMGYLKSQSDFTQDANPTIGTSALHGSVDVDVFNIGLKAEYNLQTSFMNFVPYLGVNYQYIQTASYDIHSNLGAMFNIAAETQEVFTFPLGLSMSKTWENDNNWRLTTNAKLGLIFATGDLESNTRASVIGAALPDSTMSMQVIDKVTFDAGLGFAIAKNNLSLSFDYNLLLSEHKTGHGVTATFRYEF